MLSEILRPEIQAFIHQHESDDPTKLILKSPDVHGVQMARIVEQIEGRRKAKEKLPVYYHTSGIVYPPSLNLEQSSSESTGKFKSTIISQKLSRTSSCADLTGGFGIDTFFLSKVFDKLEYVETNTGLLEIARHNHSRLGAKNILYHNVTASDYLSSTKTLIDCFYIDPSRRDAIKRKVSSLDECEPKILELLPSLFRRSQYILLKTSPLLDITEAVKQLQKVSHVYIVSVNNDCKELLFFLDRDSTTEPLIEAINLSKEHTVSFPFLFSEERDLHISFSDPEEYLYEPNASILKAGAFKSISKKFNIKKLHPNTHLYTSHQLLSFFPGRIFKIVDLIKSDPKMIKQHFPEGNANIITRNYPLSPEELRSKVRLKIGGEKFLIGFSGLKKKFLAAAKRIV